VDTLGGDKPSDRLFAQCFAHAHRAPSQCAKPSPSKVSRSVFTHLNYVNSLWERATRRWYAARYALADAYRQQARIRGSHQWFATINART